MVVIFVYDDHCRHLRWSSPPHPYPDKAQIWTCSSRRGSRKWSRSPCNNRTSSRTRSTSPDSFYPNFLPLAEKSAKHYLTPPRSGWSRFKWTFSETLHLMLVHISCFNPGGLIRVVKVSRALEIKSSSSWMHLFAWNKSIRCNEKTYSLKSLMTSFTFARKW